jgi:hypothetical protein
MSKEIIDIDAPAIGLNGAEPLNGFAPKKAAWPAASTGRCGPMTAS